MICDLIFAVFLWIETRHGVMLTSCCSNNTKHINHCSRRPQSSGILHSLLLDRSAAVLSITHYPLIHKHSHLILPQNNISEAFVSFLGHNVDSFPVGFLHLIPSDIIPLLPSFVLSFFLSSPNCCWTKAWMGQSMRYLQNRTDMKTTKIT